MKNIRKGNTYYTTADEMEKKALERVARLDAIIEELKKKVAK